MSADPTAVTLTIPTLSTHPVLGDPPPAVLANSVAVDLITVSAFNYLAQRRLNLLGVEGL